MPKKIYSIYPVAPGSIWACQSLPGRTIVVERVDGQHAVCTTLTNSNQVQRILDLGEAAHSYTRDMRGTVCRILVDSFRPTSDGFVFVTFTGAHLSKLADPAGHRHRS
ncbi:hypothetical protein [Acrocarpospora catenulata]|uniref:hypothetical protein n=1 Tax=Acrocarpospora catenulata TaxID=2836182 RepID=UPI001BD9BD9A|nr:hypothetical protein [Acrocarpospora catenulata]